MRLSTKGRYALLGLMDLALHEDKGPVPLIDIARSLGISISYIEQLFAQLRSNGLVKGTRGPGGGYRLTQEAKQTSIAKIFDIFDSDDSEDKPAAGTGSSDYPPLAMWQNLSHEIHGFLEGITLGSFVQQQAATQAMPEIRRTGTS